jgi:hypothetical protein
MIVEQITYIVVWIIPIGSPPDVLFGEEVSAIEDCAILLSQGDKGPTEAKETILLFGAGIP